MIRKIASDHYLVTANRKMKMYEDGLNDTANNYNMNDCVGIAIHSVDRTNTDPKYLPCLIVEKIEKNNNFLYELICQYGILDNTFEVGQFVDLKDVCPYELKNVKADKLKPITIIEASKLYSHSSTTGNTCNCRSKCEKQNMPMQKRKCILLNQMSFKTRRLLKYGLSYCRVNIIFVSKIKIILVNTINIIFDNKINVVLINKTY